MPDEKTPPTGTPRLAAVPRPSLESVPTVSSVYNLLAGVAGQVGGGREDVDNLRLEVAELRKTIAERPPEIIRVSTVPSPDELAAVKAPSSSAPPAPRPSLAAKAGTATVKGGTQITKWLVIAGGVLVWAAQAATWIAKSKPEYSPLADALSTLAAFFSGRLQ